MARLLRNLDPTKASPQPLAGLFDNPFALSPPSTGGAEIIHRLGGSTRQKSATGPEPSLRVDNGCPIGIFAVNFPSPDFASLMGSLRGEEASLQALSFFHLRGEGENVLALCL